MMLALQTFIVVNAKKILLAVPEQDQEFDKQQQKHNSLWSIASKLRRPDSSQYLDYIKKVGTVIMQIIV